METGRSIKSHATYMHRAFAPSLDTMIEQLQKATKDVEYDTIIGTGLSGALVVPTLARTLGKKWAIVRKRDGSHSTNKVEGEIGQKWIFVDDMIATGETLKRVKKDIQDFVSMFSEDHPNWGEPFKTEYVGTYQYQYVYFRRAGCHDLDPDLDQEE